MKSAADTPVPYGHAAATTVPLDLGGDPGPLDRALAGEIGADSIGFGAEGATAPETLRQTDREDIRTLESRLEMGAPKEQVAGISASESLRPNGQRGRETGGSIRLNTRL